MALLSVNQNVEPRNYPSHAELIQQVEYLNSPSLLRIRNDVQAVLQQHFDNAEVSIIKCPDLRESPFHLVAPGISGNTVIMEMGGPEFLWKQPMPDAKNSWKILDPSNQIHRRSSAFVIGAGRSHRTFNSEIATNFICSKDRRITNKSYFNFVNAQGKCESEVITNPNHVICDQHGSFFISNGTTGCVFKMCAKGRRTNMNFPSVIQSALETSYEPNYFIGLGGIFVINNGIVRNEIRRPSFASDSSSKIFDTFTPLVAVGTILSRHKHIIHHQKIYGKDAEPTHLESNITTQNFHTFAYNGDRGGHFINDITPDDIEYEGYFNLAKMFIRVSPPQRTYELPC